MKLETVFPHLIGLHISSVVLEDEVLSLALQPKTKSARCPLCKARSHAIHSHYQRLLLDLPVCGVGRRLHVKVRRFRCHRKNCPRRVFCERLPYLTASHARTTLPVDKALQRMGVALGGNPGARLCSDLGIPTSPSTLLRRVKALPDTEVAAVRVLGVDDWAWRKGQRYGTILCDLEQRCPIDLLPDRTAKTLIAWLTKHPEIEIVSRDRGGAYAEAANEAAPQAQQVADRFHLLKNLAEALQRLLDRPIADLNAVATELNNLLPSAPVAPVEIEKVAPVPTEAPTEAPKPAPTSAAREARLSRYEAVRHLAHEGLSERAISRQFKLSRVTVRKYVRADRFPERASGVRSSKADGFASVIAARLQEGGHTVRALWQELRSLGYTGAYTRLLSYVRRISPAVAHTGKTAAPRRRVSLSAKSATWLFLRKSEKLSDQDRWLASHLCDRSREIADANVVVQGFARLIRKRQPEGLEGWLAEATKCGIAEMVNFARGIRQDYSAVKAAMSLPWSNGPVEGQVNRLKLVKRTMYGRAGFPLLRKRYLPGR